MLLLLLCGIALADELPLFAADDTLEIAFELPLRTLIREAADQPIVDGTVEFTGADGITVRAAARFSTRGRSRLATCRFPPLWLWIDKNDVAGTVFEGQKWLKVVTHCQSSSRYRGYILKEYGIYKALNVLTDVSFRTRMLDINYRDTDDPGDERHEPGFLIESISEVRDRTGLERIREPLIPTRQLDPAYTTLTTMFQYMIGNTDWSVKKGPGDSDCCHNGRALGPPGEDAGWMVVPYDFDQTGVVNPEYAQPSPQLRILTVRQRLWRGRCVFNDQIDDTIALFNERREEIESALNRAAPDYARVTRSFIAGFYKIINDPKQRQRSIDRHCMAS